MKTIVINGKVVVINETREEAIETFNDYLEEFGCKHLSEKELIDWNIRGGESNAQLREWAHDYASEMHTEQCEEKRNKRNY